MTFTGSEGALGLARLVSGFALALARRAFMTSWWSTSKGAAFVGRNRQHYWSTSTEIKSAVPYTKVDQKGTKCERMAPYRSDLMSLLIRALVFFRVLEIAQNETRPVVNQYIPGAYVTMHPSQFV